MTPKVQFDDSRTRTYRRRIAVLAFRSDDPCCFDKSWGKQDVRQKGGVIVPLSEEGAVDLK